MVYGVVVSVALFIIGLAILLKGADFFTDSCANIAREFGVSDILIGMTLVAFATTLPELSVSLTASFSKVSGIALGNVLGSNIVNIGLVFAVLILLGKVRGSKESRKGGAIMLLAIIIASALIIGGVTQLDGAILFSMIVLFIVHTIVFHKPKGKEIIPKLDRDITKLFILLAISLAGIILGSRFVVESAVVIARFLGVTEIVIGITVIAIGTSLPELTNAFFASRKGYTGIAMGNLIGANLFNISTTLGLSAIIAPIEITNRVLYIDIPFMLFFAIILVVLLHQKRRLGKFIGIAILIPYVIFLLLQIVKI